MKKPGPFVLVPLQFFKLNPASDLRVASARDTYLKKLKRYNLVPLFVSPYTSEEALDELYHRASGVFFMGGSDIDPSYYHARPHPLTEVTERDRDQLEQSILKRLLQAKDKPFLGICRGCQSLGVAAGGSLIQHVEDVFPTEKHDVEYYHELLTAPKHPVAVEPKSRLREIVGESSGQVNSAHHQAVGLTGPALAVAARSPAGVTEAIEHVDRSFFCFGIQAHPETEEDGFFEPVFAAFAEAVGRAAAK